LSKRVSFEDIQRFGQSSTTLNATIEGESEVFLLDVDFDILNLRSRDPSLRNLTALIICDLAEIRLAAMNLIKDTFSIYSFFVSCAAKDAIDKLKLQKKCFDIIVIEKNIYNTLDDGEKQMFESLVNIRDRLSIMIVPDCEHKTQERSSINDDNWFHSILFPLPSVDQLKSQLKASDDEFAKMICDMPRSSQLIFAKDTTFRVLLVCSSPSSSKIMNKQLTTLFEEMDVAHKISVTKTAIAALDKCAGSEIIDLIIVDNAMTLEMGTCELLEFMRNQRVTENSLIVILSKSLITNTADLVNSGADILWPKPLPDKETLRNRLSRVCRHYKFN
jgi:CheY-like chemotaxis protein